MFKYPQWTRHEVANAFRTWATCVENAKQPLDLLWQGQVRSMRIYADAFEKADQLLALGEERLVVQDFCAVAVVFLNTALFAYRSRRVTYSRVFFT